MTHVVAPSGTVEAEGAGSSVAFACMTALFFSWGFITSLVDPLVAAVKGIFTLSDLEAQLSASAFFLAYGVVSLPAAALSSRAKPISVLLGALGLMGAGCLLMLLAVNVAAYPLVLAGLFTLAGGITMLQVAANPLVAALGSRDRSHFRLTFAQALNSLGTLIGPYLGAVLFLRGLEVREGAAVSEAARASSLAGIDRAFLWIAALLALLAGFLWLFRRAVERASGAAGPRLGAGPLLRDGLGSRWLPLGATAIFLYVGAEVAIGTQMALFLNDPAVLDAPLETAGKMVSLYWGGALIGRFVGSVLLVRANAAVLLGVAAALAAGVCLAVAIVGGPAAGYLALSIGLFNSFMFPVIFSLTLERSTASREATSGLLCLAIVGGAAVPPLMGWAAGVVGYLLAFVVLATCYVLIAAFAAYAFQARRGPRPGA